MSTDRDSQHVRPNPNGAPLVSVIMGVYNGAAYVGATLASAVAQTHRRLEIIVVDDGSNDRTAEIVEACAARDPRIRLIRQPNRGVAAARNRAIAAASGEFIAPLDADDLWDPTKIDRQVRRLQECGSQTSTIYTWWAWIDANENVLDRSPRWRVEGRALGQLAQVNFTGSASVPLYRRSCLDEVGGYNTTLHAMGCQGCEDWDLALRMAERYSLSFVPAILVAYRRRSDSMSTGCETMWRSQQAVMKKLGERQPSLPRATLRRSRRQFALHLAGVAFWSSAYIQACGWALRALPLTFIVLRYLPGVFLQRVLGQRVPSVRFTAGSPFDETRLREPLIPYDDIYARRRVAPPMGLSGRWFVQRRDMLRELVSRDLKLRYKGSVMGQAWTLLNPLAELLVLVFIFNSVLQLNIPNYSAFLFTGLIVYGWFRDSLYYATAVIVGNRELIRSPDVPSAILPVVTVLSTLVHFVLSLPILFGLLMVNRVALTSAVLMLPVLIVVQFALILSLAYPLATLHVWLRDTQYLLRIALQLLFYLTPIFYQVSAIPPRFIRLYTLNPMLTIVEAYRDVLLRGKFPAFMPLLELSIISAGLLAIGVAVFKRTSHRFADEL
ncbi:MAG TPA: glycosyltransferase [Vicinamibacterales bacterium]|nr:glycosyltransferase [Vicinamibacterales bacterium]